MTKLQPQLRGGTILPSVTKLDPILSTRDLHLWGGTIQHLPVLLEALDNILAFGANNPLRELFGNIRVLGFGADQKSCRV